MGLKKQLIILGDKLYLYTMLQKPSIPKGTRDFGPEVMKKRNYVFNIFRKTFSLFGFNSIETPSLENIEILNGKYGDEGDKLIFRILNSSPVI